MLGECLPGNNKKPQKTQPFKPRPLFSLHPPFLRVMKMPEGLSWVTLHGQQNENYMPMPSVKVSQTPRSSRAPEVSSEAHPWQNSRFCSFPFMILIVSFSLPFSLSLFSIYIFLLSSFLFSPSLSFPFISPCSLFWFFERQSWISLCNLAVDLQGVFLTPPPKGSSWRCVPSHPVQRICPWRSGPVCF